MAGDAPAPWLPDLCRLSRLAVLFGVAEMVVLVVALAPDGGAPWNLNRFVSGSGFALWLALTVAVTMLAICLWSTTVGALVPIVAERFGVDPAVLSAPLITTLVDATGLVIYFSIAKIILQQI